MVWEGENVKNIKNQYSPSVAYSPDINRAEQIWLQQVISSQNFKSLNDIYWKQAKWPELCVNCNQIIVHILLWSWLKSNTGVGNNFFLYSFNSVFLKTSYKTEMPLSNKINTTVIHDMISNKNLKCHCEGKKNSNRF